MKANQRLSLHHGELTAGPFGPAGDAPIVVQRLLDAGPPRRLLSADPERDLAYVVSDSLFDDVVRTGFCALRPDAFQAVKVTAKGAVFRGHIPARTSLRLWPEMADRAVRSLTGLRSFFYGTGSPDPHREDENRVGTLAATAGS
ncbi:hypothetical protein GCM10009527_033270 [Actinomadura nitritigenes]|uniref:Uncharacterized protein n=1 Tax=Actinomadura nitritigenes TaxID=134602 RepID=A0ABS3RD36_9ACTN|nr:hypothetical protein [Actinomadura nitritigenes]MBO2443499.1 hypothetical protein [Actinomadura nitritigenes]